MLGYYDWLEENGLEDTDGSADAYEDYKNNYVPVRRYDPYARTMAQVYATGNKWAIENFHATHG